MGCIEQEKIGKGEAAHEKRTSNRYTAASKAIGERSIGRDSKESQSSGEDQAEIEQRRVQVQNCHAIQEHKHAENIEGSLFPGPTKGGEQDLAPVQSPWVPLCLACLLARLHVQKSRRFRDTQANIQPDQE